MKKHYETPSVQIEKFDLQDPEIHTVWESHETGFEIQSLNEF